MTQSKIRTGGRSEFTTAEQYRDQVDVTIPLDTPAKSDIGARGFRGDAGFDLRNRGKKGGLKNKHGEKSLFVQKSGENDHKRKTFLFIRETK